MANMKLTDAQHLAATSVSDSVLVAAGAGSGKTHVLVERMIENLERSNELKVSSLMAVTFTRKAAEEMRIRLKVRIRQLAAIGEGEVRARWEQALREIDSAHIGTIHSLCQAILRNFPVECKVDPHFEAFEDEDPEQAEIIRSSIEQAFRELLAQEHSGNSILLNYPFEDIAAWLSKVMKSPLQFDEALSAFKFDSKAEFQAELNKRLEHVQQRLVKDLISAPRWQSITGTLSTQVLPESSNKLELLRKEIVERVGQINSHSHSHLSGTWAHLLAIGGITLREGGRSTEAVNLRETLKLLRELVKDSVLDLPATAVESHTQDWELLNSLIALTRRARDIYEHEKRAVQKLDFNDLIWRTYDAVTAPESRVRQFYHNNLKEILIDEFQDTNRMQARLLSSLAGPETRLFLIGDDKQSIYKFQGADVSTFNEWHEYFADPKKESTYGGFALSGNRKLLSLGESFRSHPRIIHFVNSLFSRMLADGNGTANYRAVYRSLQPSREASGDEERVELINFTAVADEGQAPAHALQLAESDLVAKWIIEKVEAGAPITVKDGTSRAIQYGDFAILVQRNQDFAWLEPALAARGIPYITIGGKTLLDRQEVYDLENLLQFLANPMDDHALLGVLRSPICSLSDDVLHNLVTQHTGSLWSALKSFGRAERSGYQLVARASVLLKRLLAEVSVKTLEELLRSIVTTTGYDLVLLAMPDGRQRSRNLWKIVDLAARNGYMSLNEFVQHLKNMRALEVRQSNAPLETSNAVKLMTVHRAKGLEFPAVILPALRTPFKRSGAKLIFHHQFGVAINTQRGKDDPRPLWFTLGSLINEDMELAEKKRLLYVAMTRARDYLGVFIGNAERHSESFAEWLKALLELNGNSAEDSGELVRRTVPHGDGTFLLRRITTSSKDALLSRPGRLSTLDTDTDTAVQVNLLEPITSEQLDPPSVWNETSRITTSDSGKQPNPIVVGNLFHMLMEHLPADFSEFSDEQIEALLLSLGDEAVQRSTRRHLVEEGKKFMSKLRESELWQLIKDAKQLLHESPYRKFENGEVLLGRPDLLIKQPDGNWLLVDYKTDRFKIENIEQQARLHHAQLVQYQEDLLAIAGIRAQAAIYFAQHGLLHRFGGQVQSPALTK